MSIHVISLVQFYNLAISVYFNFESLTKLEVSLVNSISPQFRSVPFPFGTY